MQHDIDFVLPWVDGSDPRWRKELLKYVDSEDGDKSEERFRDWGNLQYMFRSFEQNTCWVRKIHFVTWGHVPAWLNVEHPKLNIVLHKDFLKKEDLPVFNSRAIECNIHRINGLAEHFVYFNDDTFVLRKLAPDYFFSSGLPRDLFALNIISTDITAHMKINNIKVLSKYFNKREVMARLFSKWFRFNNGVEFIKSLLLLPWPQFTGFFSHHLPQPFLKKTFYKVWELEKELLELTSKSKFKKSSDVNQFLFKWWQILEGEFNPRSYRRAKNISIWKFDDALQAAGIISRSALDMICINDHLSDGTFGKSKSVIDDAFEKLFPSKSSFEL